MLEPTAESESETAADPDPQQSSPTPTSDVPEQTANTSPSCTILDIAVNVHTAPVQPRNCSFRSTLIGGRQRCFNPSWYKFPWLEYSVTKDAIFCYACRLFSQGLRSTDAFVLKGYSDWKHASTAINKHDTSVKHLEAMTNWSQYKITIRSSTSVATSLDNSRKAGIIYHLLLIQLCFAPHKK